MTHSVLTIAGSDSGGGAGIQADLKTLHNFEVYGMSAITALTAQNTLGVQGIFEVSPEFLEAQIRSVLSDIGADAVKTGMLSNAILVKTTAQLLKEFQIRNIVVDPVMISKSGARLLREDAIRTLKSSLIPLAAIVTPNLEEAGLLCGKEVRDLDSMKEAARLICDMGAGSVLIKGGHLTGDKATDVFYDGKDFHNFETGFIDTPHTHGTGCTLSAALAANLALGKTVLQAVEIAKKYIYEAIGKAEPIGHGISPVNHLFPGNSFQMGSLT